MSAADIETAYGLAKASDWRISLTNAQRLVKANGRPKRIDLETLDVLCDVLGVEDMNDLLQRDRPAKGKR